ncbi:MAG TPA: glucose 1-dehydrogenase [Xanthobacteraceae bacterium]|jgi:NAD(P)-dependent dehydrogenase (short-subunit alcohol dehydrogenase family)|nr:glucose 1-dehydrogenase [Xanthobacteraceae bacterium]
MSGRFAGRGILVTGAGSGIGRAAAQLFADEGGRVVVVDQDENEAQATVTSIRQAGGEALAIGADVSREADCRGMVERALAAYGRLHVAFNNAGIGASGFAVADEEEVTWSRLIDVNLKGIFLGMKYEIPAMVGAGGGAIVNTASVAGLVGERGIGAYSASKHGVVGLTRTAALDYIGQGVRINAVCPGATRTRILASWFQDPKVESFILSRHPIGRIAEPEEIARAVLFLASDDASFIVGQALAVDGGLTAQ